VHPNVTRNGGVGPRHRSSSTSPSRTTLAASNPGVDHPRVGLGEILKQFRLLLRGHADAAIRDRKLDPVAAVHHLAHPQCDLARLRELAGIAQQIEQNLLEPHGVRVEHAQVLLGFDDESVLVLLGKLSRGANDLVDKPAPALPPAARAPRAATLLPRRRAA
jgi:hypothetical protein